MAVFPIFMAEIENDLRRVLSYSLNNQLGFMVVGIGVGTELAINGAVSHAFAHILYKSLLFMSVGAVLYRTGTSKASELGGLYRTMPRTALLCIIGAASISAFPLFSAFVTKSLTVSAVAEENYPIVWLLLIFASAGVLSHSGIKIPYFAFFAHDSGLRPKEAPTHMQLAMGITAALSIFIGVYPYPLYALLPYPVEYVPYTMAHVMEQMLLLSFALLAFGVLMRTAIHPPEIRAINLDTDWTYRWLMPRVLRSVSTVVSKAWAANTALLSAAADRIWQRLYRSHGPEGRIAQVWPTGSMVLWIAILLGVTLVVNFAS